LNYFYFFEIQNNSTKSKYDQYYMLNMLFLSLPEITYGVGTFRKCI